MQDDYIQETIKKITKLILTNEQKMVREEDLINLCDPSLDFHQIINFIYDNLKEIGFELITTKFLEQKYYILTSDGIDDTITPSQYGTLALITALSKEIDENLKFSDINEIFSEVWDSDIKFLLKNDYLRKLSINDLEIIQVSPLGKALMKNIIQNLQLKNLIDVFKKE